MITTLAEAQRALEPLWPANTKHRHTLEFMTQLMDYLGNPQDSLKVIHVAGTSGKTSTCYYVAALLQAAGQRVGLTVSPHVDTLNERVQISLTPMPAKEFGAELSIFLDLLKRGHQEPNYFECMVAFAFWEFARQQVDYAVVEVGVGGLLDSTNVMTREDKVCVLTDIGLDHTRVLGETLPEIAAQKAGIIQLRNAVFCYEQSAEVMRVFDEIARRQQAELYTLPRVEVTPEMKELPLFQQRNFGLAKATVEYVLERDKLPELASGDLQKAAQTLVPARMEIVQFQGKTLIMDAAHNAQKLQALAESVRHKFPGQDIAVLAGLIASRPARVKTVVEQLSSLAKHLVITGFRGGNDGPVHSIAPAEIAQLCDQLHFIDYEKIENPEAAFAELLKRPEPILLVAGSFYLLNHIRPLLR